MKTQINLDLNPLNNNVIVLPLKEKEERSEGGIILDGSRAPIQYGQVVKVANGISSVKPGELAVFNRGAGLPIKRSGHDLLIMDVHLIKAVVPNASTESDEAPASVAAPGRGAV